MPDPDADSESTSPKYELVCNQDACDKCAGMAGFYYTRPPVPVHPNCKCRVQTTKGAGVRYVVRNLQTQTTEWEQTQTKSFGTNDKNAGGITFEADCGIVSEEFDEGVGEALNWDPPCDSIEFHTLPLKPGCETTFVLVIGFAGVICQGERWEIRETEDGTEEEFVGEVGGMATACTGLKNAWAEGTSPL